MSKESYIFPTLSIDEILDALQPVAELRLTRQDLEQPNADPAKTRFIYEYLTCILLGVPLKELREPIEEAIQFAEIAEYPIELYSEAIQLFTLHQAFTSLMEMCLVDDVSLDDLTKPESRRLIRNLSAIINFAKFRDGLVDENENVAKETQAVQDDVFRAQEEKSRMEKLFKTMRQETQGQIVEFEGAQAKNEELAKELDLLKDEQKDLQQDIEETKNTIVQSRNFIDDSMTSLKNLKLEKMKWTQLQVSSPKKIRGDLELEHQKVDKGKRKIIQLDEQLQELALVEKKKEQETMEIKDMFPYIEEVEKDLKRYKETVSEVNAKTASLEQQRRAIEDEKLNVQDLENQLKLEEEKSARLQKANGSKKNESGQSIVSAIQEKKDLENEIMNDDQREESARAQLIALKQQYEALKAAHLASMEDRKRTWESLESHVERYNKFLLQSIS